MATKYKSSSYGNASNDNTKSALIAGAAGFGLGLLAAVGRRAAVQAVTAAAGDWFEGLKTEHKMARGIIEMMEATSEADTKKRKMLLLQLQHALGKHAVQEEDVIYCVLRMHGQEAAADQLGDEHNREIKQALYELELIDKASPEWLQRVRRLKDDIEAHVRKEEDEIFPQLKSSLSEEENKALTVRMNFEGFKVA